nr:xanthine dehydrogenase accessory protein XdhC [Bdellovibrio sp. HM001]
MSRLNFEDYLTAVKTLQEAGKTFVSVTLVNQQGSSPQEVGARALISAQGLEFGTVGGGKVEKRAIEEAQKMIQAKTPHLYADWNLQKDIGMTCGGVVSFFFELHEQNHPFHIYVFGAGHIAQEFVRMLTLLDCRITCVDPRQEWIDRLPKSSKLKTVCTEDMKGLVASIPDKAYITLMTMGHGTDLPVLIEVMKQRDRFTYVGNVGSDQKARRLRQDLLDAGLPQESLTRFFCPMGENFGTNSPVEIAFSIVAQILKTRDQNNEPA